VDPSTKSRLLVATPALADGNFDRSVVYMLEHNDDGALGVILNRPSEEAGVTGLETWAERCSPPAVVFGGGPVEPDALIGIALATGAQPGHGWAPIDGPLGTVDLATTPDEVAPILEELRLFRGYAGWSPGQLESEIEGDAWIVAASALDDVFTRDPSTLWRRVLKRQGGRLAWMAHFPDDVAAN
jgi:putative transcriptional regulator